MSQNLEEIARLAGVSRSTVSRVINSHPNVSERTRLRVMRVIQEQNFRPNLAARSLVTQRTRILSLVIPQAVSATFTDPYFPTLIQSIMLKANEFDYAVMLWLGKSGERADRLYDRVFKNSLFDGMLVAAAVNDDPLIPRLTQANFPVVLIGPPSLSNLNYIDVDNQHAAEIAVSYLIQNGWKRIGTITGPLNMGAAVARLDGYCRALQQAGLPVDKTLIVEGNYDEQSGYTGMRVLLERHVDAVFSASDVMALGALRAIHYANLRVPDDIAIVGFDDLPVAATATPPLTTIHQPIHELGSMATEMLIDLLDGKARPPYQKILPAQLVVRESTSQSHG